MAPTGLVQRLQHLGPEKLRRHRSLEQLLSGWRAISHAPPRPGLVLDLDHQHGVLGVGLLQMRHYRRERLRIGFHRGLGVRRRRINRLPVAASDVGILLGVAFHPFRHVVVAAVLPGGKPQEHQTHLVLPRLLQQDIHQREIELPGLGLDLFPIDGDFERVGVEESDSLPDPRQHGRPRAGVVTLCSQHQKWLAVHDQGVPAVLTHEMGQRVPIGLGPGRTRERRDQSRRKTTIELESWFAATSHLPDGSMAKLLGVRPPVGTCVTGVSPPASPAIAKTAISSSPRFEA